jgi:hypothetical protein
MKYFSDIAELCDYLKEHGDIAEELQIKHRFKLAMDRLLGIDIDLMDALMQFDWYLTNEGEIAMRSPHEED